MKTPFRQKLWQAVPWLWMAAGYLFMLWYHIVPGHWIVDSDLAGEMVLADLLNKEGGILTTNWFYTTEIRVLNLQWLYRLGLLLFPHSWHAARVFSMALALLLLAAAALFFTQAAGMGRAGVWCTAALMWPFGSWYLFLCLYGGQYLVYIIVSLLTLGIVLHLRQRLSRTRALLLLAAGAALGLITGLNGVRQLMVLYGPLSAALLVLALWQICTGPAATLREAGRACPQVLRMLGSALLFTACSAAGYLINLAVFRGKYSFNSYDTLTWLDAPISLLTGWRDYLLQFGYQAGQPLFSFSGIAGGLGLLLGIAVLVSLVWLALHLARLELPHQVVAAFTLSGLLIQALILCYLGPYQPNYWLPFVPFGLIALLLVLQTGTFRPHAIRPLLALCLALCLSVCSAATVRRELAAPTRGQPGLEAVVTWLQDRGYTGGYAYFWTGQAVTELSDGQIEMWTVIPYSHGSIHQWLQRVDHLDRIPEAPCFMLFDLGQDYGPESFAGGTEVYRDDRYAVVEFTDPAAFFATQKS